MISVENFLKDTKKYLDMGVVVLTAQEYERLAVQETAAESGTVKFYAFEEAFKLMDDYRNFY